MATLKEQLLDKIARKEMRVGVVGLGYVGLPLAVEKAKAGFKTIGFDVNSEKVRLVNEGGQRPEADRGKRHAQRHDRF